MIINMKLLHALKNEKKNDYDVIFSQRRRLNNGNYCLSSMIFLRLLLRGVGYLHTEFKVLA